MAPTNYLFIIAYLIWWYQAISVFNTEVVICHCSYCSINSSICHTDLGNEINTYNYLSCNKLICERIALLYRNESEIDNY
jgi:hypothetical protein